MKKKTKKILYVSAGFAIMIMGWSMFFLGHLTQTIILGLLYSCFGAVMIGWNLA